MKKIWFGALATALSLFCGAAQAEWREVVVSIDASFKRLGLEGDNVGWVDGGDVGSGFVASEDGLVLTARHVVADWAALTDEDKQKNPIRVRYDSGVSVDVDGVEWISETSDLALLRLKTRPARHAFACFLNPEQLSPGEEVTLTAVGFLGRRFSSGGFDYIATEDGLWRGGSDFARGMSGGPLFYGEQLRVAGIVTKGSESRDLLKFATPIAKASDAIERKLGYKLRDCRDPSDPRLGEYVLEVERVVSETIRQITTRDLGRFGAGGYFKKGPERKRANATSGWTIDISSRESFKLHSRNQDNARCEEIVWNSVGRDATSIEVRAQIDKRPNGQWGDVHCSLTFPEITTVIKTVIDDPVSKAIPWDEDTIVDIPDGATGWVLTVYDPLGKKDIFVGPATGRRADLVEGGGKLIIKPK